MKPAQIEAFFATLKAANPMPVTELEYTSVFELLTAVLLSAQATDVGVNKATRKLFPVANTPAAMVALGEDGRLWWIFRERQGSLDTAIRNAEVNDFAALAARCPSLRSIAHNGGESYKHARHTATLGVAVHRLPSTSPANASWSFERKLAAWRSVCEQHGLI